MDPIDVPLKPISSRSGGVRRAVRMIAVSTFYITVSVVAAFALDSISACNVSGYAGACSRTTNVSRDAVPASQTCGLGGSRENARFGMWCRYVDDGNGLIDLEPTAG